MAGESQQTPETEPDPSVLTTQQLERGLKAERDFTRGEIRVLEQRLSAMDRATDLLSETVNRVPTAMQVAIENLRVQHGERFDSIALQFKERDTRQERESRDNKVAVDAAFAAQKEAASEAKKATDLAVDKSERATAEKQEKMADLFKATTDSIIVSIAELKDSMNTQIADIKSRLTVIETITRTIDTGRDNKRLDYGLIVSVAAVFVSIIAIVIVVLLAIRP